MKKIYILLALCALAATSFAQQKQTIDSTKKVKSDTIRIGGIIIIKNRKKNDNDQIEVLNDSIPNITKKKKSNINYFIIDAGFGNWNDQTNYTPTPNYVLNRAGTPAFNGEDLKLRAGKSYNINFWLFMQKVPLSKTNVNLKYGLGLEWFNYELRSPVSFRENAPGTNAPYVYRDSISFSKNKFNLKYVTIPLMLNFSTTKQKGTPTLSTSFGVSASYLIRERNKQNSNTRGRERNQGDYDLNRFKLSYIAELGLGRIRLYGTYSPKSIFERGLDIRPYALGIRFSNW